MEKLFLYGPSGSGKSTIARKFAELTNEDWIDMDLAIEQKGTSIPEIFATKGEAVFRQIESETLREIIESRTTIISLGGGSLISEENRQLAEKHGQVICLQADANTILERLSSDSIKRPLLQNDPQKDIALYLAKRQTHYDSFSTHIDTVNKTPAQICDELSQKTGRFQMKGDNYTYPVLIKSGILSEIPHWFGKLGLQAPFFIVTDTNVAKYHLDYLSTILETNNFHAKCIIIEAGEKNKTLDSIQKIWDAMLSRGIERSGTLISLGGGVIGDMGGFAAATILRGINWVNIPTSLLSMVDSSIGGKTGFNLEQGKNLAGAFFQPKLVLIDPSVLSTLPAVEISNGLAEMIKHGVIAAQPIIEFLENHSDITIKDWEMLLRHAVKVKIDIVHVDPYEKGIRQVLNFGHTIGHGIEKLSNYEISHGQSVSIGMVTETILAEKLGISTNNLSKRLSELLTLFNLPTDIPIEINKENLIRAIQYDKKKKDGKIPFALPESIGCVKHGIHIEHLEELI